MSCTTITTTADKYWFKRKLYNVLKHNYTYNKWKQQIPYLRNIKNTTINYNSRIISMRVDITRFSASRFWLLLHPPSDIHIIYLRSRKTLRERYSIRERYCVQKTKMNKIKGKKSIFLFTFFILFPPIYYCRCSRRTQTITPIISMDII